MDEKDLAYEWITLQHSGPEPTHASRQRQRDIMAQLVALVGNVEARKVIKRYEREWGLSRGGHGSLPDQTKTHREHFLHEHEMKDEGHSLEELSEVSHVPLPILQEVYNRGIGAYKTNPSSVRLKGSYVKGVDAPMDAKLSKEQWAMARVYSFLDGNAKHDNDLRRGGHRPFPAQFSAPVRKILKAVSIGIPTVVGSAEDHKVMYLADYDLMEEVELKPSSVASFQALVRRTQKIATITDIKCGEVLHWNLLKGEYDREAELKHLGELWQEGIITESEVKEAKTLLTEHLTIPEKLRARKELRFGVLRWTPAEIYEGRKTFRKHVFYLEDCFKSTGITKVDVVAWMRDKYMEVSNIILWHDGKKRFAKTKPLKDALAEDIVMYEDDGNYVKVAKRMLSLAKDRHHITDEQKLRQVLNSPLGAVYTVVSDLELLDEFPDAVRHHKREELDSMRDRMAKVFFPEFDHVDNPKELLPRLREALQEEMKKQLELQHLLPLGEDYRPKKV